MGTRMRSANTDILIARKLMHASCWSANGGYALTLFLWKGNILGDHRSYQRVERPCPKGGSAKSVGPHASEPVVKFHRCFAESVQFPACQWRGSAQLPVRLGVPTPAGANNVTRVGDRDRVLLSHRVQSSIDR